MTIRAFLKQHNTNEATDILSHLLNTDKTKLFLSDAKVSKETLAKAKVMLKTYKAGKPLAYILGYKYFYGLKFKVSKHVLIPRPETEWLVEQALNKIKNQDSKVKNKKTNSAIRNFNFSILDIGTGSGCIAISISHSLSTCHLSLGTSVTASDISASALTVAMQNDKIHKADVTFIQSDLFKSICGKYNIITANLPYVPQGMYELLYHNLKYEPKVAITDGGEIWNIYNRFFKALPRYLKPSGTALLEIDDGSKPDLQKMIKKLLPGWKAKFSKDLGGLWRYLELQR